MIRSLVLVSLLSLPWPLWADELPPAAARTNLALGRTVVFSPRPDYEPTSTGDSDSRDLTDGKISQRENRQIWHEPSSVGWKYAGRVNLAVDLGRHAKIDEVAIRLVGGASQPGISMPGWIEAFVSDNGEDFTKVAEFSRWTAGDMERHGVPAEEGSAWVHCLRFGQLAARGRWVGLRMYTSAFAASDELFVFGEADEPAAADSRHPLELADRHYDFSIAHPQPYFHKPYLVLAKGVASPVPVGLAAPAEGKPQPVELVLQVPQGMEIAGGEVGGVPIAQFSTQDGPWRRYSATIPPRASNKAYGRLHICSQQWPHDLGTLVYSWTSGGWRSGDIEIPITAVQVEPAPRLRRIMVGLGGWPVSDAEQWPNVLDDYRRLGLNTFSVYPHAHDAGDPAWKLVEAAREQGFRIAALDSPMHRMMNGSRARAEIYHQFAEGPAMGRLCPSYRGPFYQAERERFATGMGRAKPDMVSADIELWGHNGPTESQRCSRCLADFHASGLSDWDEWYALKGDEIWRDLVAAARKAVEASGGKPFEMGGYDFRPGPAYQRVWSVDRNYPEWMQMSQPSVYTSLNPYHLALIGDEVRHDRARLGRGDVQPWLSPGDAGAFPGESLQWALLECYANGARGVWFWSRRVWDGESLLAYNRVVRAIAPVEDIIVDGDLVGDRVQIVGRGRLSGMRRGADMVLLAADYLHQSGGTLRLDLQLDSAAEVRDLLEGDVVSRFSSPGQHRLELPLAGKAARLLHVKPQ